MSEILVKNIKNLRKKDVNIAGGKGASLGEMTQAGMPVPPGFVVLSSTFDEFIKEAMIEEEINGELKDVDYKNISSVGRVSKNIRALINRAKISKEIGQTVLKEFRKLNSKFVAVRSSATTEDSLDASWAGELETYLGTTEKNLLKNVRLCWSSLYTPRAIIYRKERGLLNKKVSVAVVVQKMIESEVSGVVFTVHPVTKNKNHMIIEAGFGLGEAIVSGSITPDSFIINKKDLSISDVNISTQKKKIMRKEGGGIKWMGINNKERGNQKISGERVVELAGICVKIEKHYKKPQDIEWALEDSKLYIMQSRPITTLQYEKQK